MSVKTTRPDLIDYANAIAVIRRMRKAIQFSLDRDLLGGPAARQMRESLQAADTVYEARDEKCLS